MFLDNIQNVWNASPVSVAIAIVIVFLGIILYYNRDRNLPPGPTGIPILGIYPFLSNEKCHLELDEYGKKYGSLYSFRVAEQLYVNLGSPKLIREVHVTKSEIFSNRHNEFNIFAYVLDEGVPFINGEPWKVLRKFFLQIFKDFGMISLKGDMSGPVHEVLNSIIKDLRTTNGKQIDIVDLLMGKITTILCRTLFGHYPISEEQIQNVIKPYKIVLDAQGGTHAFLFGRIAKYLIFRWMPNYRPMVSNHKLMVDAIYRIIDDHESTLDEDNIRDVMDAYLKERNDRRREKDPSAKYFTRKSLMSSFAQFIGDSLVVVHAVGACFHSLLEHPEEQDKIYKEILEVVGPDRQPSLEDKSNLSYTNAFIFEVFRTSDFFPFFPSLMSTKEVTIQGYRIPKGTIALMNMWSAHHDPEEYEEPYKFDPSRYIVKLGKKKPELPFTFGRGKRSCIGEAFTMMHVFLFLTNIVKNFRLSLPEGEETNTSLYSLKLNLCAKSR
ncbi:cytochrome P450 2F3-like isoform X1 [Stegodyphus dumicola]|uniref:cytochrome P450 2F3-like isoform X1 n=1 Tax=Stegodyphus dumicola TaxID=202533 RepID=UPI0015B11F19|nr:cytochrome P450 2F3-like isoform X1 [Stegodyphus dumicola]